MRRHRSQDGFTLVEVMAATFIIAIAFLGLAGVHIVASKAHSLGGSQTAAMNVATEQIELMRRSGFSAITTGAGSETVDGVLYTFIRAVQTNIPLARRLTVVVVWGDRFGAHAITTTTLISQVTNP